MRKKPVPLRRWRSFFVIVFILYLMLLLWIILFKSDLQELPALLNPSGKRGPVNLEPAKTIRLFWYAYQNNIIRRAALFNLIGNVLLFVPFGFLLPLAGNQRKTLLKTAVAGLVLIGLIEFLQWYFAWGVLDVDDMILNFSGILIGWIIYKLVAALRRGTGKRRRPAGRPG